MSRLPFSKAPGHKLHNFGSSTEAVSMEQAGKRPKAALFPSDHRSLCASCLPPRAMRDPRWRFWSKLRNFLKHFRGVFSLVLPDGDTGNRNENENHSLWVLFKLMLVLHSLEHVLTITLYYVLQFQKMVSKMFFGLFIFPYVKGKAFPFASIESKTDKPALL